MMEISEKVTMGAKPDSQRLEADTMKKRKWVCCVLLYLILTHTSFADIKITHGPVLGRPGSRSMGIWARTNVPGSFRVRYGLESDKLDMVSDPAITTLEKDNTGWILLQGLSPGMTYFYQVFSDGDTERESLSGTFRTLPEAADYINDSANPEGLFNFKFEFACGNQNKPEKYPVYQTMLDRLKDELDFAILNGDWLYEMERGYKPEDWIKQTGQSPADIPDFIRTVPHIVGVWENYKVYYDLCEPLRIWHRNVPSYYTFDDHEILDDCRGAGSTGHHTRIAVYRDIGVQAWYDYLGWSNPVIFRQDITFGKANFTQSSDVMVDIDTDFTQVNLEAASNLHVHWGDDYAWRHLKRYDGKGGVPNAGVYEIKEIIDSHRLRIYPPAKETAQNAYSIGRLSYFNRRLSNCEFFFLDTRSHRQMPVTAEPDKPGQSLLGDQQKKWVKEQMRNSTADFLFVVSSVNLLIPHIVDAGGKGGPDDWPGKQEDSWSGFPEERSEMIAFWKTLGKPVLVLTGDLHNSFVVRSGENLWEFASGPHSSGNARAIGEGNRPPNGPWEYRGETFDIRWSTFQDRNNSYNQKVYCVIQVNNVLANEEKDGRIRWIAYPQPSVTVQYYDGLNGKLLYAESVLSE
jgi:phosphodiesterase/alkaline phosphatase D-like protein